MMTIPISPNRAMLERAAERLRPLLDEIVFVGGHVAELLVTDPAATRVRPTDDVDVIVQATSRGQYHAWEERIRKLGFEPDTGAEAPMCRHRTADGVVLDLMPTDEQILGFSNRWYPLAIETAELYLLRVALAIQIASAPAFIATKWIALDDRYGGNAVGSHDFEDIATVVAGRPEVVSEARNAPPELREWLAARTRDLLADLYTAEDAIGGALPDAQRLPGYLEIVVARFEAIANLSAKVERGRPKEVSLTAGSLAAEGAS